MHKFNFLTITLSFIVTSTSFLMTHSTLEAKSQLNNIIPPEIKNDFIGGNYFSNSSTIVSSSFTLSSLIDIEAPANSA